ncbi:MAG: polyphosphate--glucose phosphotransferase [Acidimicrobiia bacterium]
MNESIAIGIDIGGTGIKAAPVTLASGALVRERIRVLTPHPATPDAIAQAVVNVVARIPEDVSLGITLPAVVRNGIVETAANIDEQWIGTAAEAVFARATGRACGVVNDADAAGIAEMRFGAGKDNPGVVFMVTLGTGIGTALFVDGVLIPNTELGHLMLPEHGEAEKWASEIVREDEELSWHEWAHRVQTYLRELERLFWPDLFIIGGGVSKKADKFLPEIELRTPVVPAMMHNDAGIVGAALFAPV